MEEDVQEEEFMGEDSPPCKVPNAEDDDENFPDYVLPRRFDVNKVELPKKANTIVIAQ